MTTTKETVLRNETPAIQQVRSVIHSDGECRLSMDAGATGALLNGQRDEAAIRQWASRHGWVAGFSDMGIWLLLKAKP